MSFWKKINLLVFFSLFFILLSSAEAVPLNIIATPQNTQGFRHNLLHDAINGQSGTVLSWLNLGSGVNSYDPDNGLLDVTLDIFTNAALSTNIGVVRLQGSLPGARFDNSGQLAGSLRWVFQINDLGSPLYTHLVNHGLCSNIAGHCEATIDYLALNYGITPQGRRFNSWENGYLSLWGADGKNILGSDLVLQTARHVVPEPSSMFLLSMGAFGLFGFKKK